jgi:hypothetical protein
MVVDAAATEAMLKRYGGYKLSCGVCAVCSVPKTKSGPYLKEIYIYHFSHFGTRTGLPGTLTLKGRGGGGRKLAASDIGTIRIITNASISTIGVVNWPK